MAACGSHPAFAAEDWGRDRLLGGAGMRLGPLRDRVHPPGLEVMVAASCQLTAPVPCSRASDTGQLGSLGVLHSSETTVQAGGVPQDACGQCPHQDQNPKPCPQKPYRPDPGSPRGPNAGIPGPWVWTIWCEQQVALCEHVGQGDLGRQRSRDRQATMRAGWVVAMVTKSGTPPGVDTGIHCLLPTREQVLRASSPTMQSR